MEEYEAEIQEREKRKSQIVPLEEKVGEQHFAFNSQFMDHSRWKLVNKTYFYHFLCSSTEIQKMLHKRVRERVK